MAGDLIGDPNINQGTREFLSLDRDAAMAAAQRAGEWQWSDLVLPNPTESFVLSKIVVGGIDKEESGADRASFIVGASVAYKIIEASKQPGFDPEALVLDEARADLEALRRARAEARNTGEFEDLTTNIDRVLAKTSLDKSFELAISQLSLEGMDELSPGVIRYAAAVTALGSTIDQPPMKLF